MRRASYNRVKTYNEEQHAVFSGSKLKKKHTSFLAFRSKNETQNNLLIFSCSRLSCRITQTKARNDKDKNRVFNGRRELMDCLLDCTVYHQAHKLWISHGLLSFMRRVKSGVPPKTVNTSVTDRRTRAKLQQALIVFELRGLEGRNHSKKFSLLPDTGF